MDCSEHWHCSSGFCPICGQPCGGAFVPKKKKGSEFEGYVLGVVESLAFFGNSKVSRNRRFEGKTQPGVYEIDIAVEINVKDLLHFLLIVECKDWGRPVDRPVVQNVIQTREAIAAQKAAIVSPFGFTKEAIEVAKAHGIALWVLSGSAPLRRVLTMPPSPTYTMPAFKGVRDTIEGIKSYPQKKLVESLGGRCASRRPLLDAQFAESYANRYSGEVEWEFYGRSTTATDQILDQLVTCLRRAQRLYWLRL